MELQAADRVSNVTTATAAALVPMTGSFMSIAGRPDTAADAPDVTFDGNIVAPGYFELVGIALRAGRGFDPRDGDRAPRVAVVSESLARKLWKTPAVLGRTIRIAADAWAVVGVVADVPYRSLSDEPQLRTVEMAIRRALGATDACILRLVMRPGLWLLAIGGVAGCLGGVAGAKALHSVFLGLPPIDFTVVVPAATLLAAVVAVAAWLPARRAVSIEPAAALKQQS